MPPVAHPTSEDRHWRRRRKGKSRTGGALHGLRMRDLEVVLQHRWGETLPDDDAGRDDAILVLHHLAHYAIDPRRKMQFWLGARCPWLDRAESAALIERAINKPRRYRADTLAAKLGLKAADRTMLGISTIGAVDFLKEKRMARRRERDRARKERERRNQGAKQRADYLANSLTKAQPWLAEGISRRTWERRRLRAVASPATA